MSLNYAVYTIRPQKKKNTKEYGTWKRDIEKEMQR